MTLQNLVSRIGSEHVERRLKVEAEHEAQLFGQGLLYFNLENWRLAPWLITWGLKFAGLYQRARRNADEIVVRRTSLAFSNLPSAFDGFTILHLSDLHADISEGAMRRLADIVGTLEYDVCVLTGDYRGNTYGPFENALQGLSELRALLKGPLYGVLGNHDSLKMAPAMEAMGIRMLFNEHEPIARGGSQIYLAGVDDAHFYRADDIEKAASGIPKRCLFGIAIAHTGSLQASRGSRIRSHVERTYPWGPALPARWNPDQAGGRTASINGRRHVASCGNDWLYVGRRRYKPDASPSELPARNHVCTLCVEQSNSGGNVKRSVRRFRAFLFQRWQP